MENILEEDQKKDDKSAKYDCNVSTLDENRIKKLSSEPITSYGNFSQKYLNGREPSDLKYSAARTSSASSTSLVSDGFSASKSAANSSRSRQLQHGDVIYTDQSAVGATKRFLQAESLTAEQNVAYQQVSTNSKLLETTIVRFLENFCMLLLKHFFFIDRSLYLPRSSILL